MSNQHDPADEFGFDDLAPTLPEEAFRFIPANQREKARALPPLEAFRLTQLPPPGAGHNKSLKPLANCGVQAELDPADILAHLEEIYEADRADHDTAPARAVDNALADGGHAPTDSSDRIKARFEAELLDRFKPIKAGDIMEATPDDAILNADPLDILSFLFKPNDLICLQREVREHATLVRLKEAHELKLPKFNFLAPATFLDPEGIPNEKGRRSFRCNANVKGRQYMVLECDNEDEVMRERFNGFAMTMAAFAPLVMVVDTGGKSLHFWFDTKGLKKAEHDEFWRIALRHGADSQLGVKCQVARLPNVPAQNDDRRPQCLIYFDPERTRARPWDLKGFERKLFGGSDTLELAHYYEGGKSASYWAEDIRGEWLPMNRTSLTKQLERAGVRVAKMEDENISPGDDYIARVETENNIRACIFRASGRFAGFHEENGERFLVATSPHFITPLPGDWSTIRDFLTGLLGMKNTIQLDVFFGWLSLAMKALRNDTSFTGCPRMAEFGPSQMLHVVGPPNSGKTLLLERILQPLFGGRMADAGPLFQKDDGKFNSEMFGAELLYIDDSPDMEFSEAFRNRAAEVIKRCCVGQGISFHAKGRDKLNVRPWWRLVRMMNSSAHILETLPNLEVEGTDDKIVLLKAGGLDQSPINNDFPGWFDQVATALERELPHFMHFLLEEFELPRKLFDSRYGVVSYKDPELMIDISKFSKPELLLYELDSADIFKGDDILGDGEPQPWDGTATRLHKLLSEKRQTGLSYRKNFKSRNVLSDTLKKLSETHPDRVRYSTENEDPTRASQSRLGQRYWTVYPEGHFGLDDDALAML